MRCQPRICLFSSFLHHSNTWKSNSRLIFTNLCRHKISGQSLFRTIQWTTWHSASCLTRLVLDIFRTAKLQRNDVYFKVQRRAFVQNNNGQHDGKYHRWNVLANWYYRPFALDTQCFPDCELIYEHNQGY